MARTVQQSIAELEQLITTLNKTKGAIDKDLGAFDIAALNVAISKLTDIKTKFTDLGNVLAKLGTDGEKALAPLLRSIDKIASQKLGQGQRVLAGGKVTELTASQQGLFSAASQTAFEYTSQTPLGSKITSAAQAKGIDTTKKAVQTRIIDLVTKIEEGVSTNTFTPDVFSVQGQDIGVLRIVKDHYKDYFTKTNIDISKAINDAAVSIPIIAKDVVASSVNVTGSVPGKAISETDQEALKDLDKLQNAYIAGEKDRINKVAALEREANKQRLAEEARLAKEKEKLGQQELQQKKKLENEKAAEARKANRQAIKDEEVSRNAQLTSLREAIQLRSKLLSDLDEENRKREKAKILTQDQVNLLKQSQRFGKPITSAEEHFAGYGVDPNKIQYKVTDYGKTGISKIAAEAVDASGKVIQFNQTLDRFGNTVVDIPKRLQGFGDKLRSNAKDFLQWTLIAGTFYSVFQKVTEITGLAIKNQEELANITVALGKAQSDTNKIFEDAYEVSKATGESLDGVLEGYSLAYRVTSEYADANERATVTNKLMVDSLALSKLSTLNQAEALDVLVAGLEQSGAGLEKGSQLLDKWVAIARQSNADLASLAQAYAIVGKSAENAGLSMEGVAALTSALAKSGVASGKELGNQLRTIISGFQSSSAEAALNKYGIAIKDINGNLRTTDSLLREVAEKSSSGIISPTALSEITLAVGGGGRGQQRVAAAIQGYLDELAKINSINNTEGAAQEALSVKLETVATSVEKLQNSFQNLAQTIGTDGGLLDLTKGFIDLLTLAIDALDKFASFSGKSFLPLIATAGAALYAGGKGGNNTLANLGNRFNTFAYGALNPLQGSVGVGGQNLSEGGNAATKFIGNNATNIVGSATAIAIPAIFNAINGDAEKAGANIGGGIVGAVIGSLTPFGPIVGASIGSAAGEGIVSYLNRSSEEIANAVFKGLDEQAAKNSQTAPQQQESEITKQIAEVTRQALTKSTEGVFGKLFELRFASNAAAANLGNSLFGNGQQVTAEQLALAQNPELLTQIALLRQQLPSTQQGQREQEQANQRSQVLDNLTPYLAQQVDTISQRIIASRQSGATSRTEYIRQSEAANLSVVSAGLPDFLSTLFPNIDPLGPVTGKLQEAADTYLKFKVYATDEENNALNTYITTIKQSEDVIKEQQDLLAAGNLTAEQRISAENTLAAAQDDLARSTNYAGVVLDEFSQNLAKNIAQFDIETSFKEISRGQFNTLATEAEKQVRDYLQSQVDFSTTDERDQQWLEDQLKQVVPTTFDFGDQTATLEINQQILEYIKANYEELKDQTGIMEQQNIGLGFYENIPADVFQMVAAKSVEIGKAYEQAFPGYDAGIEELIAVTADGTVQVQASQQIMNFLLGQIEENTAKQVEGLYNMPDGASFYFPSSVLPYVGAANQSSGMDLSKLNAWLEKLLAGLTSVFSDENVKSTVTTESKPGESYAISGGNTLDERAKDNDSMRRKRERDDRSPFLKDGAAAFSSLGYDPDQLYTDLGNMAKSSQKSIGFFDKLSNYFSTNQGNVGGSGGSGASMSTVDPGTMKGLDTTSDSMNIKPQLGLKLNMSSNINVNLDGRQIWNAIKQYAREDLLNYEGTTGSVTRNVSVTV